MMKNSSVWWKLLVESWKFRCQQQCLKDFNWKISTGKLVAKLDNTRRNVLVLLRPTNLWELRMEGSQSKNPWRHIAGKGVNSLSHYNFVHKFNPIAWSHEDTRCKVSSGYRMRKFGENTCMTADESQKQKWGESLKQGLRAILFILRR